MKKTNEYHGYYISCKISYSHKERQHKITISLSKENTTSLPRKSTRKGTKIRPQIHSSPLTSFINCNFLMIAFNVEYTLTDQTVQNYFTAVYLKLPGKLAHSFYRSFAMDRWSWTKSWTLLQDLLLFANRQ